MPSVVGRVSRSLEFGSFLRKRTKRDKRRFKLKTFSENHKNRLRALEDFAESEYDPSQEGRLSDKDFKVLRARRKTDFWIRKTDPRLCNLEKQLPGFRLVLSQTGEGALGLPRLDVSPVPGGTRSSSREDEKPSDET
jgi:hypothetical protein